MEVVTTKGWVDLLVVVLPPLFAGLIAILASILTSRANRGNAQDERLHVEQLQKDDHIYQDQQHRREIDARRKEHMSQYFLPLYTERLKTYPELVALINEVTNHLGAAYHVKADDSFRKKIVKRFLDWEDAYSLLLSPAAHEALNDLTDYLVKTKIGDFKPEIYEGLRRRVLGMLKADIQFVTVQDDQVRRLLFEQENENQVGDATGARET